MDQLLLYAFAMMSFGKMPTFIGCVSDSDINNDNFHEMVWGLKPNQLYGVVNPPDFDKIYVSQHNEVVGRTWRLHHKKFHEFIEVQTGIKYLEIGSGSGILIEQISQNQKMDPNQKVSWDVIDPNPVFERNEFGAIHRGFFPDLLKNSNLRYDVIVHSHLIEHVYDPIVFLDFCNQFLTDSGLMYVSWPNMVEMSNNFDLNILMFEHLTFLPKDELLNLLYFAGFKLLKISYFERHSIFLKLQKVRKPNFGEFHSVLSSYFFQNFCKDFKKNLNEYISICNLNMKNRNVDTYIFGAHIFAQYLIAGGLNLEKIIGILDNATHKNGKRLYGTNFLVSTPDREKFYDPVNIILAAGQYEDEIIEQLQEVLPADSQIISKNNGIVYV